jgi:hypothetical protein
MSRTVIIAVLALGAQSAFADGPPPPRPPTEPPHLVDVEVGDQDGNQGASSHFMVAVSGSGATSQISAHVGEAAYQVKLRRDVTNATYVVEVMRHRTRPGPPAFDNIGLEVDVAGSLEPEQRKVVAAIARPNGTKTEVALTLR